MEALGFRRINQTLEKSDTPQIRGMIRQIKHLVSVEEGKQS
jgi:large subunit ribosomal protein L30